MRRLFQVSSLVLILLAGLPVMAQTAGDISGTVTDETKAVLPGVSINVTNMETNARRSALSDDQGRYQVLDLNPGVYSVQAELAGFKTTVRSGIEITIGREARVDLALSVGEINEKVVVTGDAPLVETGTGTLGGLVNREQIKDLPLNGRSYQDLMGLQPGVVLASKATSDVSRGMGSKFSASGTRSSFNQFLVDGAELNDHRDSTPASVGGFVMGVEAVREFKVLTNSYTAEYGRNAGAVMSVVSKSGTNRFHGSLYEFHRNDGLDARNFFTKGADLPFRRNQFGVEVDGPVIKDRTFFMANFEGVRQKLEVPRTFVTLDQNARLGLLPGRPAVPVNGAIAPYLALLPLPTPGGRVFTNGTAEFLTSSSQPVTENYFTTRIDHELSQSMSLMGRYSFDKGNSKSTNLSYNLFGENNESRSHNMIVEERTVFTSRLLNTVMFAVNKPFLLQNGIQVGTFTPAVTIAGRSEFGSISVTGIDPLSQTDKQNQGQTLIDFSDNAIYTLGNHSLKFGGSFKRFFVYDDSGFRVGGTWTFSSIENLLRNQADEFQAPAAGFDPRRDHRQNLLGFYLQDDFKVRERLTLNLGLRYEFVTTPYEINGKQSNLRSLPTDTQMSIGKPLFINPSLKNFAPRFGFAWDAFGDGKTALRGGFGIFYSQLLTRTYERALRRNPPFFRSAILRPPPQLPLSGAQVAGLQGPPQNTLEIQVFEYRPATAYMMQYNLSLQREVAPQTVMTVAYTGSRGVHLTRKTNWNNAIPTLVDGKKFFAAGLSRRNPNFSRMQYFLTDANSVYNALQLGIARRLSQGFQMQANYLFARNIDDGTESQSQAFKGTQVVPQDPDDRRDYRGLSDFHVKHNFVFNASYQLPWGNSLTGVAGKLAGGWQISNIVRLASGPPFVVELGFDRARNLETTGQRPNLRPGFSNNPVLGGPDRYFDVNAFELQPTGFFGNLGRNTLIGPGLAAVDLSLLKNIGVPSLSEDFKIQFRVEGFNIFNRANFSVPQLSSGTGGVRPLDRQGNRVASAAALNLTSTSSRQIQLALKVLF